MDRSKLISDRFASVRAELVSGNAVTMEVVAGAAVNTDTNQVELLLFEVNRDNGNEEADRLYIPLAALPSGDYVSALNLNTVMLANGKDVEQPSRSLAAIPVEDVLVNVASQFGTVTPSTREVLRKVAQRLKSQAPS